MEYPRKRQRMMTSAEEREDHSNGIQASHFDRHRQVRRTEQNEQDASGRTFEAHASHEHKHGHSRHSSYHQNNDVRDVSTPSRNRELSRSAPRQQKALDSSRNVTTGHDCDQTWNSTNPSLSHRYSSSGTNLDLQSRDTSSTDGSPSPDSLPVFSEGSDGQVTGPPSSVRSAAQQKTVVVTIPVTPVPVASLTRSHGPDSSDASKTGQSGHESVFPLVPLVVSAAHVQASIEGNPLLSFLSTHKHPSQTHSRHSYHESSAHPTTSIAPSSSHSSIRSDSTSSESNSSRPLPSSFASLTAKNSTSSSHPMTSSHSGASSSSLSFSTSSSSSASSSSSTTLNPVPAPVTLTSSSLPSTAQLSSSSAPSFSVPRNTSSHEPTTFATSRSSSSIRSSSLHSSSIHSSSIHSTSSHTTSARFSSSSSGGNFGAGDIPGTATSSTPAGVPSAANVTQNSTSGSGASTGQIAGGVVGGLAGLSLLLIGALLFLRWYKRKRNAASSALSSGGAAPGNGAGGPETAEAATGAGAGVAGAAATGAGAAGFMKRFSQRSPQPPPPAAGERGFQRISGRKLPSQFSPGAQGPSNSGTRTYPSGSSAYPSGGTFLSDATAATAAQSDPFADPEVSTSASSGAGAMTALPSHETNSPPGEERFMPGPARTPVVHQAGDPRSSHLAAPSGPAFPRQLGRSSPALGRPSSYDSSRGSRFTEDVA